MVLGHSSLPIPVQNLIYSFHMPFFFFISGFLSRPLSTLDKKTIYQFIKKKAISLLLPFAIYSIINILLYPLYGELTLIEYIAQIIKHGWGSMALWFIPVFFMSVIISKLCITTRITAVISSLLLIIISFVLAKYKIQLPWNISTIPFASVFMIFGYIMKDLIIYIVNTKSFTKRAIIIFFTTSLTSFIALRFRLDMATNCIIPIIPIIIAALAGIISLLTVSSIFSNFNIISKITQYIGRHTYEVLGFSQVIIMIINSNTNWGSITKYIILIILLYCIFRLKDSLPNLFSSKNN